MDTHVCGPAGTEAEADRGASSRRYGDETVVDQGMVPWGRPPEQVPGRRLTALLPSLVELYLPPVHDRWILRITAVKLNVM